MPRERRDRLRVERLEDRLAPAAINIQAGTTVRTATAQLLGVNLAWWDSNLNTATQQLIASAGTRVFRQPGGSSSDTWHFTAGPAFNGASTTATFNAFTAAVNGVGVVTVNYGTASPQEAAAWLAYCNAPLNSNVSIGIGQQWNGSAWVNVDWHTSAYWAALRAAAPIIPNDGLNFLRVGRAAPYGWKYWEGAYGEETDASRRRRRLRTRSQRPQQRDSSKTLHDPSSHLRGSFAT